MQKGFDTVLISNLLLFIDHEMQRQGMCYNNYSGLFYPIKSNIQGLYAFASPFRQLCNDTSISGAQVMSGVYLNNNYINVGQSGLVSINHYEGTVYFNTSLPSNTVVSGNYAIKDFNIELTNQTEFDLLFQTKFVTNSKYNQVLSGVPLDFKIAPAIFLKYQRSENKPFAFLRTDNNTLGMRAIVITDNEYQRIGVCNILKNLNYRQVPIVNNLPFDYLGNYTGVLYNYTGLSQDITYNPWITKSRAIDVPSRGEFITMNHDFLKKVFFVDFEVETIMNHL